MGVLTLRKETHNITFGPLSTRAHCRGDDILRSTIASCRIQKMPERVSVNGTLFLHVGKAGGGTVMEHVQGLGFNVVTAHPNPIPHNPQIHTYLMNLRDPVDRFCQTFTMKVCLLVILVATMKPGRACLALIG